MVPQPNGVQESGEYLSPLVASLGSLDLGRVAVRHRDLSRVEAVEMSRICAWCGWPNRWSGSALEGEEGAGRVGAPSVDQLAMGIPGVLELGGTK